VSIRTAVALSALALATMASPPAWAAPSAAPNELGRVPVLEYHRFGTKEERWTRTFAHFRQDLEFLYNNGYVSVNAVDLARGNLDVPAGKKPVVLTFDDATSQQFKVLHDAQGRVRRDGRGRPISDPQSAVGILDAFSAQHPDFGKKATFFVLPNAFEVSSEAGLKLQYLIDTGREVANHTYSHPEMKHLTTSQIINELVRAQDELNRELGHPHAFDVLALPFGINPKDAAGVAALKAGGSGAHAYHNEAVFLVGADPAPSPFDRKFNMLKVPRIQAIDDEFKRHFHRAPGSTARSSEAFKPYVSDGNPATVTFPSKLKDRLSPAALRGKRAVPTTQTSGLVLGGGGAGPAKAAPAAPAGLHVHPGYHNEPLPPGGEYVNGRIFHTVQKGQQPTWLANQYLHMTDYYTRPAFERDILAKNGLHGWLPVGKRIEIPGVRAQAILPHRVAVPKTFVARGIYVTKTSAATERVFTLVKEMKPHGLNTVVFDIKDMDGHVAYQSKVPLAVSSGAIKGGPIRDVPKLIDHLHQMGMHVVAREALFHDDYMAQHRRDLAVRSKHGGVWREKGKLSWLDPNNRAVRDYEIGLAKELAGMGVDEIQFDYIRFPAMGQLTDIAYSFNPAKTPKDTVITSFLQEAYQTLHPMGVLVSLDVFGVVAWDEAIDVRHTGQRLDQLGKYADVISPMVYPSHFYPPFFGHKYPADEPYFFVNEGVKRTMAKTKGTGVVVRPWLQAFKFMVHHYGPDYVAKQIQAADEAHATGYLLWNAGNEYGVGLGGVARYEQTKATLRKPTKAGT
jgi:hypothetical protein